MSNERALVWIVGGSAWGQGGVERYCERLSKVLERQGFTCEAVPTNTALLASGASLASVTAYFSTLWGLIVRCLRHRRRGCNPILWLQYGNALDLLTLLLLSAVAPRTVLCTVHVSRTWFHLRYVFSRFLAYRILRLMTKVCVLTRFQHTELLDSGIDRVVWLPSLLPDWVNNVPLPNVSRTRTKLLFLGRLTRSKGVLDVLHVGTVLRDQHIAFHMSLVGSVDPGFRQELIASIRVHKLDQHVELVGPQNESDVLDHLRTSSLLLHPSYTDTYPLVLLEAMAAGLFVIAYDLPGAKEIVRDYGYGEVVRLGDQDAFACRVIANLRATIEQRPQACIATQLSWLAVGEHYARCLREMPL